MQPSAVSPKQATEQWRLFSTNGAEITGYPYAKTETKTKTKHLQNLI